MHKYITATSGLNKILFCFSSVNFMKVFFIIFPLSFTPLLTSYAVLFPKFSWIVTRASNYQQIKVNKTELLPKIIHQNELSSPRNMTFVAKYKQVRDALKWRKLLLSPALSLCLRALGPLCPTPLPLLAIPAEAVLTQSSPPHHLRCANVLQDHTLTEGHSWVWITPCPEEKLQRKPALQFLALNKAI